MSKSEFRDIGGTVDIVWADDSVLTHALYAFGNLPFLFVRSICADVYTFLNDNHTVDGHAGVVWRNIELPEHLRLEYSTVMQVRNIARETAKRLGVEVS